MKLTTTPKAPSTAGKGYTQVEIHEKTGTRFIERESGTVLSLGVGKFAEVNPRTFRTLVRNIVRTTRTHQIEKLALELRSTDFPKLATYDGTWFYSTLAENLTLANYEYTTYKSKKPAYELKEVLLCGIADAAAKQGITRGMTVGEYVNRCRDIANTPGGAMTPALLAEEARAAVRGTKAKITVFDKKRIEKEKMGALLAVAQGTTHGPRFIIMEYAGTKKTERPIVLVGKGITFDTGGLNLKPGDSMLDMHMDMSGGAAVIAAVAAIAKLGLKRNVIGLIPAAENAVSDESMRPGDILTTLSGKTVDVLNTDAEGRLVLADALTYAKRYNPRLVVDVATLTGAALVALGMHASALMTKQDDVREKLMTLAEDSGDYLWPLPLWDEYKEYTKGRFGDIANIPASGNTRAGGTINGGMFLAHFTEDYAKDCGWAHIDMAPRMTSIASDKLAKGATGEPTRLLVRIAEVY